MDSSPPKLRFLWPTVAAVWLVAVAMIVGTVARVQDARARLPGKLRDLRELSAQEKEIANHTAARRFFESLPVKHPAPLDPLLKKTGFEVKVKDIANPPSRATGWRVRRKDVDFGEAEVSLANIMQWIRETELADSNRPPWRVARISARASARNPGSGHVVLLFEALEQSDAETPQPN
ncbi:MAG: hypothetical protein QME60_04350 [Verrucomicrobiota bacterium]|nr:hypothetical protein [Verrucomicrobiota bacterium]